jgi:hypothetical protein
MQNPLLNEAEIVAFHELEATAKIRFHPAIVVLQAVRQPTACIAKPPIDRDHVVVLKTLDHHEQHGRLPILHAPQGWA